MKERYLWYILFIALVGKNDIIENKWKYQWSKEVDAVVMYLVP